MVLKASVRKGELAGRLRLFTVGDFVVETWSEEIAIKKFFSTIVSKLRAQSVRRPHS